MTVGVELANVVVHHAVVVIALALTIIALLAFRFLNTEREAFIWEVARLFYYVWVISLAIYIGVRLALHRVRSKRRELLKLDKEHEVLAAVRLIIR